MHFRDLGELRDKYPCNAEAKRRRENGFPFPLCLCVSASNHSNCDVNVIFVLYSFDTGHPVFAFWTAVSNASFDAPGTRAFRSRWLSVIANPSGCFSRLIEQVVSMLSAV